jgi:hypothetical protein
VSTKEGEVHYLEPEIATTPQGHQPPLQQQQQQQMIVLPGGGQSAQQEEKKGIVMLSCNVECVEIYLDGAFVGNAPANLKLKPGIHMIEIKRDGYITYRKELRVIEDSETTLRVELEMVKKSPGN